MQWERKKRTDSEYYKLHGPIGSRLTKQQRMANRRSSATKLTDLVGVSPDFLSFQSVSLPRPQRTGRSNKTFVLTDISDSRNSNYKASVSVSRFPHSPAIVQQILVRTRAGKLRYPTDDEFRYIRRREKPLHQPFRFVAYTPSMRAINLKHVPSPFKAAPGVTVAEAQTPSH